MDEEGRIPKMEEGLDEFAVEEEKKMDNETCVDEKDLTGKTYGFYVAGVQHHDIYKVMDVLKEEDFLSMVLEPSNQYDPNAVRLEFRDVMIGYVPMKISADISALIMSDEELWGCKIIELKWDEKSWKQVKVSIEEIN